MAESTSPVEPVHPIRDLSDFRLFTLSCEWRFPNAYLLWDRAGRIWSEFSEIRPGLRAIKADPGQTIFRLANRMEFNLQLNRCAVIGHGASCSEEVMAAVADLSALTAQHLEIERYSRIGIRHIFIKVYPNDGMATDHMLALNLLRPPPSPSFGISGVFGKPRYAIQWEDKSKGCLLQVFVNTRQFEPEVPFAWEGPELEKFESIDLTLDVDYYTVGSVSVGQINLPEWIKQAIHVVRRDSGEFLRGK